MLLISVLSIADWCNDYILDIVVDRKVNCWLLHFNFLLSTSDIAAYSLFACWLLPVLTTDEVSYIWGMMRVLMKVICSLSSLIMNLLLILILRMVTLSISVSTSFLRVCSIFTRSYISIASSCSVSLSGNKRPIHSDELVNEVIDTLLILSIDSAWSLTAIKILCEDLFEILMELFSALVF